MNGGLCHHHLKEGRTTNDHVENMYVSQKRINRGMRPANECGNTENRTGAGIGAAIPPYGLWCLLKAPVGALIGFVVGEVSHNERRPRH